MGAILEEAISTDDAEVIVATTPETTKPPVTDGDDTTQPVAPTEPVKPTEPVSNGWNPQLNPNLAWYEGSGAYPYMVMVPDRFPTFLLDKGYTWVLGMGWGNASKDEFIYPTGHIIPHIVVTLGEDVVLDGSELLNPVNYTEFVIAHVSGDIDIYFELVIALDNSSVQAGIYEVQSTWSSHYTRVN